MSSHENKLVVGLEMVQHQVLPGAQPGTNQIIPVGTIRVEYTTTVEDEAQATLVIKHFEREFGSKIKTTSLAMPSGPLPSDHRLS